ncbi:MAG TPA: hypothetical protein VGM04_07895 [Sphingomicrobium sp.]|jgi:hypothetical protein
MRFAAVSFAAMLVGCAAPEPPPKPPQQPRELAGRVAGPPERCVLIQPSEALRVSENDRQTLLYGTGRTIWANRVGPGCGFSRDDILVSEPIGSHYCHGDVVRSFDRFTRIPANSCRLGDFVAYTR